jgi:hypothetical protein
MCSLTDVGDFGAVLIFEAWLIGEMLCCDEDVVEMEVSASGSACAPDKSCSCMWSEDQVPGKDCSLLVNETRARVAYL